MGDSQKEGGFLRRLFGRGGHGADGQAGQGCCGIAIVEDEDDTEVSDEIRAGDATTPEPAETRELIS